MYRIRLNDRELRRRYRSEDKAASAARTAVLDASCETGGTAIADVLYPFDRSRLSLITTVYAHNGHRMYPNPEGRGWRIEE